jgi:hypothetical protein
MWKVKDVRILLIIALLCSTTSIAFSIKVPIPDEIKTKLGSSMIEALKNTPIWLTIDSIVGCTEDVGPDYVERIESIVGDLIITKKWECFKAFQAQLYPPQVIEIAKLATVWRIDLNEACYVICSGEVNSLMN